MSDIQYRVKAKGANVRTEPDISSNIVTTLLPGVIVHLDPDRTVDERWVPVLFCRGYIRDDMVERIG